MPEVRPSSGEAERYARKRLAEAEEELRNEASKAESNRDERVKRAEETSKNALAKKEEAYATEIQRLKDAYADATASARERETTERNDLKTTIYDQHGKLRERDLKERALEGQLVRETLDAERKSVAERMRLQDETFSAARSRDSQKHTKELETTVDQMRNSMRESYGDSSGGAQKLANQEREELRARLQGEISTALSDRQREKAFLASQVEKLEDGYHEKVNQTEESASARAKRAEQDSAKKTEEAVRKTNESHAKQYSRLKSDFRTLEESQNARPPAESRDALRNLELESRAKLMALQEAHRSESEATGRRMKETETHLARQSDERVEDEVAKSTSRDRKLTLTMDEERKLLEKQFGQNLAQRDALLRKEKSYWGERFSSANDEAQARQTEALSKQHDQFGVYAREQARGSKDTQNRLESSLQRIRTTDDPKEVSAAADDAIRSSMNREFEKTQTADLRARKAADQSKDANQRARYESILGEYDKKTMDLTRENEKALSSQKAFLTGVITEEQRAKTEGFKARDEKMERSFESQNKSYAVSLDGQKRQYEEMMAALKDASLTRIEALKQEADNRETLTRREHAYEMNVASRDFNKRLNDQKLAYEMAMKETKDAAEKLVRDGDRQMKKLLDENSRGFENRRAQAELQQKERERTLSESYQDQIDKLKQTHALQLQKATEKKS